MIRIFLRFVGWWAAWGSLAVMGGVCPCCNSGFCPQGMAVWGIFGALCTYVTQGKFRRQQEQARSFEEPQFARHDFSFASPKELLSAPGSTR